MSTAPEGQRPLDLPPGLADAELALRHRLGDSSAFDELYQRFATVVFNLCARLAHSTEDAEDLAQEVFLRIHRHFGNFDGRAALKTWIYRVTLNHCRSKLARKRFFFLPIKDEVDDETESGVLLEDPSRDPQELLLAQDASERIERALKALKPAFREAVILRDLEGLSYEEIAELLQVNLGTVRSRIARGREGLRLLIEKAEGKTT
jgi:RNA polymerase sigma-70 factor (ECF subfamily)